jgi:hypothetical protein
MLKEEVVKLEKTKSILERIIKIIVSLSIILGITSTVLLFVFNVHNFPIVVSFYPRELILFLCMVGIFLLAIRFRIKYFKWIALVGVILSGINLAGFNLLLY